MSRKKNISLSADVEEALHKLADDKRLTLIILAAEEDKHVTVIRGKGDRLSEMVRATLENPENEEVATLANILICGLGAAMLENDSLYGLADHIMEKVAELRTRQVMGGGGLPS